MHSKYSHLVRSFVALKLEGQPPGELQRIMNLNTMLVSFVNDLQQLLPKSTHTNTKALAGQDQGRRNIFSGPARNSAEAQ